MGSLKNKKRIVAKGLLFLIASLMAMGLILLEYPDAKLALLVAIAVWCMARFYHFAFYVLEHYVDGRYRYAGLFSLMRHALGGSTKHLEKP